MHHPKPGYLKVELPFFELSSFELKSQSHKSLFNDQERKTIDLTRSIVS